MTLWITPTAKPTDNRESLEQWADRQGRPTASLIAFIVETAVLEAKKKGDVPPGPEDPKSDT